MSINAMETHGAFSWMEHQSGQAPEAREFYRDVLNWDVQDVPMQDGSGYPVIMVGEQKLGGFLAVQNQRAAWLPYVTVDNVDKRVETAVEAGGKVLSEPMTVPGVGRMATLEDPSGATLALISYEAQPEGGAGDHQ